MSVLTDICSLFAAGQDTRGRIPWERRMYVVGLHVVLVLIIQCNQQTSKKVQLATQIAQIDPRISRAIFEHNSFQKFSNWWDSDCTQPIFKINTESVREKVHLSFPARRFFKSSANFQKISFANRLHTSKGRFYRIFKFTEGLEGYFRDSGFDQNTVRESGKWEIYWRDPGFDCSPGSGTRQKLGTGCGIYVCMSVGNAGNRHDPPVLAAKANQPGER